MKRRPLLVGNWKMHTTVLDACHLAADIAKTCVGLKDRDVLLAPPFTVLSQVAHVVAETGILLAAQNVCWEAQGAFTGEISPLMVLDAGGAAAIVGHSERRQIFHEDNALINKRVRGALAFGLVPILCVGETLDEREGGQTFKIIEEHIRSGLAGVVAADMGDTVLAYEPVWAIGTGQTATKEQAQEVHAFIRNLVAGMYEKDVADQIRILYGGSVKPDNIDALMAQDDIDGALVGGAALNAESFERIIHFQEI
ncbi:MAG: triose-phosphate isomerase [Proteobacteria bacterium]|nr:triose-phosphate isomerase [Desulfocapsa sp.]MBU3945519.1 triose-phosphate isomerase [Pseudomonadota bacterium]MCG2745091.1 triose-phosphate isomerase [Desulfobacteraceae bacterium]MBU4029230.1 triose-phosphate isomerase [Pseudomonadota bacterium]MBU4043959.1 triose-phosphate isomerase [Pseudomonadota bacterium]